MNENYPLHETWFRFLDWVMDRTNTFPKNVRFSLTQRIQNLALDLHEDIIEAIYTKNRLHILHKMNMKLEKLRFLMRLSYHRNYINIQQFEHAVVSLEEAGKMIGGWIKKESGHETER